MNTEINEEEFKYRLKEFDIEQEVKLLKIKNEFTERLIILTNPKAIKSLSKQMSEKILETQDKLKFERKEFEINLLKNLKARQKKHQKALLKKHKHERENIQ